jgi:hypothetical protein
MDAFVNDGCNPLLTMTVITKKMLTTMAAFVTLMAAFVIVKMLMMAANVVTLTMPAFVNDGCNQLLMMAVIIMKIFFRMVLICRLTVGRSVVLTFYRPTEGQQRGGGSVKILPTPLTTTHVEGR